MGDDIGTWRFRADKYRREAHLLTEERDEAVARVQRLEALVSWIDGRCVDFSTTPHATVLAGEIRAAINRYREEQT